MPAAYTWTVERQAKTKNWRVSIIRAGKEFFKVRVFNHSECGTTFVSERNPRTRSEEKTTRKVAGWIIAGAVAIAAIAFTGTIGVVAVGVVALIKICADI